MGLLHNKLTIVMILVITGTTVGDGVGLYFRQQQQSPPTLATNHTKHLATSVQPIGSPPIQPGDTNFITTVVEKVGPAVVKVDAIEVVSQNPLVEKFLGDFATTDRIEKGTGSGFILSADGKIVTNAHVVDGVATVKVTLKSGRVLEGKVIGIDRVTDIAVIRDGSDATLSG